MFLFFQFVDLLNPNLPTKDMKVELMLEIAKEHGVEWDPESFDNRSYKPHSFKSVSFYLFFGYGF